MVKNYQQTKYMDKKDWDAWNRLGCGESATRCWTGGLVGELPFKLQTGV